MMSKLLKTIVISILITVTGVVSAGERRTTPPEPFAPIYGDWVVNGDYAAFIFYRNPDCVPDWFDFFVYVDIPGAFFCNPVTVEGFAIYEDPADFTPKQGKFYGLGAVPEWFVEREVYDQMVDDGVLTMQEVVDNSSISGFAHCYRETLHTSGVHPVPMKNIIARGTLDEDSSMDASFKIHGLVVFQAGERPEYNMEIEFK